MSKKISWRDYENKAARLFERMGFEVSTGQTLVGARGKHSVDVIACKMIGGVKITWIIECKLWRARVQKAQVLTLIQVARDVGADRAFLLSESGFQAGAIAVSKQINVTLTNLAELAEAADEGIAEVSIRASLSSVKLIEQKLRRFLNGQEIRVPAPPLLDQTIALLGGCLEATLVASASLASQFPVRLPSFISEPDPPFTSDISSVAKALVSTAEELAKRTDVLEQALIARAQELRPAFDALTKAIDHLLLLGTTLTQDTMPQHEDKTLRAALIAMRDISSHAEIASEAPTVNLRRAVQLLMRELIDGAYIWLGNPRRSAGEWIDIEKRTRDRVQKMLGAAQKRSGHAE